MSIFGLNSAGLWVDAGCLLFRVGLIVWEVIGRLRGKGSPEDDAPLEKKVSIADSLRVTAVIDDKKFEMKDAEIKRLNAQLADMQARQEASENRFAQ